MSEHQREEPSSKQLGCFQINKTCTAAWKYISQKLDDCLRFHLLILFVPDTLEALLEMLQVQVPSAAEPDKLVREAAQGHIDVVREILNKYPEKVKYLRM